MWHFLGTIKKFPTWKITETTCWRSMFMPKQITLSFSENSRRCRSGRAKRTVCISKPSLELTSLTLSTSVFLEFLEKVHNLKDRPRWIFAFKKFSSLSFTLVDSFYCFLLLWSLPLNLGPFPFLSASDHSTFCLRLFQLTADLIFVRFTQLLFS